MICIIVLLVFVSMMPTVKKTSISISQLHSLIDRTVGFTSKLGQFHFTPTSPGMDSPVFREMLTQQAQTTDALSPGISGHALIPGSQWTRSVEAYSCKSKEIIF